ncbi:hypothetical protein HK103_007666 [Boothiomyces macroporosus]|uniref:Apple domain-containing protein n=1 Tax=Boothiomyces macroporosus TaxID=261099 RepID=A0AAD5Y1M2_9FUNG|nr:hypothetical protein HK103_007666 [Boothiomyces macroporosus]
MDRPLNTINILPNPLVTAGSPNCVDNSGVVTCKPITNWSDKNVKEPTFSSLDNVQLTYRNGWYSANCGFKYSRITNNYISPEDPNGNAAVNETNCQHSCLTSHFACTAYIYNAANYSCQLYDNSVDALGIEISSDWDCGFYMNRSTNCFDDGSKINCDSSARNLDVLNAYSNGPSNPGSSNGSAVIWIIVGVVVGVLVILGFVFALWFFVFRKKPDSSKKLDSKKSNSNLSGVSTPINSLNSPYNNNRFSQLSQETQYQRYSQVPSEYSNVTYGTQVDGIYSAGSNENKDTHLNFNYGSNFVVNTVQSPIQTRSNPPPTPALPVIAQIPEVQPLAQNTNSSPTQIERTEDGTDQMPRYPVNQ